jgi:hypothetical protein
MFLSRYVAELNQTLVATSLTLPDSHPNMFLLLSLLSLSISVRIRLGLS